MSSMKKASVPYNTVKITDAFWSPKIEMTREVMLPFQYEQCEKTGRIDAWRLPSKDNPDYPVKPHIFWDSDVAKLIEASAYSLSMHADPELEKKIDNIIDLMEKAQLPDGYLNSYYIAVAPEKRWSNLRADHELYCAGHLIEAAVAYYQVTGKRKLLDILCRYADCIDRTFGPEPNKRKGYCGHEEIELALIKLYKVTNEKRYLNLAKYFIDERGREPNYFIEEASKTGRKFLKNDLTQIQAHLPVREQKTAEGHAVRLCYLASGMADAAAETNDESLMNACRNIWGNITEKRMYLTGGIGSTHNWEKFTFDYDLPNDEAYTETCAAIALLFFASRMLNAEGDAKYADIMERALYNGILSGVALDGKSFYYENPLSFNSERLAFYRNLTPGRHEWFDCACCPPNIARLFLSLGGYIYSISESALMVNLYIGSSSSVCIGGVNLKVTQSGNYPWDGNVKLKIDPEKAAEFTVALRYPGWCKKAVVKVNGKKIAFKKLISKGFIEISRKWEKGDIIEAEFDMPVEFITANINVLEDAGRAAVQRGPIVYCFEEIDNGKDLHQIVLPSKIAAALAEDKNLGGFIAIKVKAHKIYSDSAELYSTGKQKLKAFNAYAVPFAYMENRKIGDMAVWLMRKY